MREEIAPLAMTLRSVGAGAPLTEQSPALARHQDRLPAKRPGGHAGRCCERRRGGGDPRRTRSPLTSSPGARRATKRSPRGDGPRRRWQSGKFGPPRKPGPYDPSRENRAGRASQQPSSFRPF